VLTAPQLHGKRQEFDKVGKAERSLCAAPGADTAPLPPFCRTLSKERDGLPQRSQAGFHFRVVSGDIDLPGSLPALKLSQHLRLPLAHVVFEIKDLT